MAKRAANAYWIGGEERCFHCLQPYAYVTVRHCQVCDGPACPHCVTVTAETREVICIRCEQTPDEEV